MLKPLFRSLVLPGLCLAAILEPARPALSHEFWIEPEKYQVNSEDSLQAGLRNGQMFQGARLPYLDNRIRRFDTVQGADLTPYKGRMGDMPALVAEDLQSGLFIALHETTPDLITYDNWQAFAAFAASQGYADLAPTDPRPNTGPTEIYTRHAKLLVAVGDGAGSDQSFGLEAELVALQNPYEDLDGHADSTATIAVQLLYQGRPQPIAQVTLFERAPDDTVHSMVLQTDDTGTVRLPVRAQHRYLVNAVVLRPHADPATAQWETLWASLVFAIP